MLNFVLVIWRMFGSWNPIGYWMITAARGMRFFEGPGEQHRGRRISLTRTDLVLETCGASASHAFVAYILKFNPDLDIAHHAHCEYPMIWAMFVGRPRVFLIRKYDEHISSSIQRWPKWRGSMLKNRIEYRLGFYVAKATRSTRLRYEDIIANPRDCVIQIANTWCMDLNAGDNILPRIRYSDTEPDIITDE